MILKFYQFVLFVLVHAGECQQSVFCIWWCFKVDCYCCHISTSGLSDTSKSMLHLQFYVYLFCFSLIHWRHLCVVSMYAVCC